MLVDTEPPKIDRNRAAQAKKQLVESLNLMHSMGPTPVVWLLSDRSSFVLGDTL